jgi:uncharacterized protein YbjQ (UPF0145 family)
MTPAICVRCDAQIDDDSIEIIDALSYCTACAVKVRQAKKAKQQRIVKEKEEIVTERNTIEKEFSLISEKDTKHIIVTTTDHVEGKNIGEYLDIISIQKMLPVREPIDSASNKKDNMDSVSEKALRSNIELGISGIKKRAFLHGADAVVGIRIDSSVSFDKESENAVLTLMKINITGTAVRLY